jgi:hypothetical protein
MVHTKTSDGLQISKYKLILIYWQCPLNQILEWLVAVTVEAVHHTTQLNAVVRDTVRRALLTVQKL